MRKGKDKQNAVAVCAIVLSVMLTLGLCLLLSGEGLLTAVFHGDDGGKVYMLAVGGYDDIALARTTSEIVKNRGGAGYVTGDGSYEIIYAAYPSEDDANSVLSALGDGAVYVKEVSIPSSKLKWADKDMKKAVNEALSYYELTFDALYECSNALNDGALTVTDVKTRIDVLRARIEDVKATFYAHVGEGGDANTVNVKVALVTALALVDNIEIDGGAAKAASSIRYQLVQLVFSHAALMQKI